MTPSAVRSAIAARAYLRTRIAADPDRVALVIAALCVANSDGNEATVDRARDVTYSLPGASGGVAIDDMGPVLAALADARLCRTFGSAYYIAQADQSAIALYGARGWLERQLSQWATIDKVAKAPQPLTVARVATLGEWVPSRPARAFVRYWAERGTNCNAAAEVWPDGEDRYEWLAFEPWTGNRINRARGVADTLDAAKAAADAALLTYATSQAR